MPIIQVPQQLDISRTPAKAAGTDKSRIQTKDCKRRRQKLYSKINSMGLFGMTAFAVQVEVDIAVGMPSFDVVGLPDAAVKKAGPCPLCDENCGYQFPVNKITVNLAPADIKKAGPLYDLPIFIAMLLSTDQLSCQLNNSVFLGELSLNGEIRPVNGVLPMVLQAKHEGYENIFVPKQNALEGAVVEGIRCLESNTSTSW